MTNPDPNAGQQGGGDPNGGAAPRVYDQTAFDSATTRARQEGERKAQRELAKSLGFTREDGTGDVDAMKQFTQQQREQQQNQLTEVERREQAAAQREQAAQQRDAQAAARERAALIREHLVTAGAGAGAADAQARREMIADAQALLLRDLPDGEADEAALTAAVESVKRRAPGFFGTVAPGAPPAGDVGPLRHQQVPGTGSGVVGQAGADEAARRAERRGHRRPAAAH